MTEHRSALMRPEWRYVERQALDDFRAEDWTLLNAQRAPYYAEQQARQALRLLSASADDPGFGYQVNNYRHCVQAATLALQDGRDEDYVVMALLHDIGFVACPQNHGPFAAQLLAPYIPEDLVWMLERHMYFQSLHCRELPGNDRFARERWRGHPAFAATAEFVARYDQNTISPRLPEAPLSVFEPMVQRVFARPPRSLALPP
jgi:predicted HD phosphohydrolase